MHCSKFYEQLFPVDVIATNHRQSFATVLTVWNQTFLFDQCQRFGKKVYIDVKILLQPLHTHTHHLIKCGNFQLKMHKIRSRLTVGNIPVVLFESNAYVLFSLEGCV